MKKNLNAREAALKVLLSVEEKEAYANLSLRAELGKGNLSQLDRSFATELVYGTLRYLKTLDWILNSFLKKPLSKQTPATRNVLRMGLYQLLYLDKVPVSAACNESANLARRHGNPGAVKFVNGILRNIARNRDNIAFPDPEREPLNHISIKYSYPAWIVQKWVEMFGFKETAKLCRAGNESAPVTFRTNTLKVTREELVERLSRQGASVTFASYAPEGFHMENTGNLDELEPFVEGLMQVQDESSILAGYGLSPRPGMNVLDMASAPGGKTTHLAQLMENRGKILACDIYSHKLNLVEENCRKLGIDIVETVLGDARELSGRFAGWADCILLDAPCSGLGVLRRRPDIRWRISKEQVHEIAQLQKGLLDEAARCLRPGGVVLYSTCTITQEENIDVVRDFLSRWDDFELVSFEGFLPRKLGDLNTGVLQLLPHVHGTDGFFMARLRKDL